MCACEKKVYLTINNRAENPLKTPAATTINEFTGEKKVRYASISYMRKTNKYYKRIEYKEVKESTQKNFGDDFVQTASSSAVRARISQKLESNVQKKKKNVCRKL